MYSQVDDSIQIGYKPFDGEGGDGQNGGVRGRLRGEALNNAERLAKRVREMRPDVAHLWRQAGYQQQ